MSVHRFVCYFLALSACATIAFASSLLDQASASAAQGSEGAVPVPMETASMSSSPLYASLAALHGHKLPRVRLQIAQAP